MKMADTCNNRVINYYAELYYFRLIVDFYCLFMIMEVKTVTKMIIFNSL